MYTDNSMVYEILRNSRPAFMFREMVSNIRVLEHIDHHVLYNNLSELVVLEIMGIYLLS